MAINLFVICLVFELMGTILNVRRAGPSFSDYFYVMVSFLCVVEVYPIVLLLFEG